MTLTCGRSAHQDELINGNLRRPSDCLPGDQSSLRSIAETKMLLARSPDDLDAERDGHQLCQPKPLLVPGLEEGQSFDFTSLCQTTNQAAKRDELLIRLAADSCQK